MVGGGLLVKIQILSKYIVTDPVPVTADWKDIPVTAVKDCDKEITDVPELQPWVSELYGTVICVQLVVVAKLSP